MSAFWAKLFNLSTHSGVVNFVHTDLRKTQIKISVLSAVNSP